MGPIFFLIAPLTSGVSILHLETKTVNMFGLQTSFVLSLYIEIFKKTVSNNISEVVDFFGTNAQDWMSGCPDHTPIDL